MRTGSDLVKYLYLSKVSPHAKLNEFNFSKPTEKHTHFLLPSSRYGVFLFDAPSFLAIKRIIRLGIDLVKYYYLSKS